MFTDYAALVVIFLIFVVAPIGGAITIVLGVIRSRSGGRSDVDLADLEEISD